ncbi:hypothetical protein TgHK011_001041 [Trichoderma gracile]|nr:hypothetical protein TgHK011_001041 [Trichoderma gracile]
MFAAPQRMRNGTIGPNIMPCAAASQYPREAGRIAFKRRFVRRLFGMIQLRIGFARCISPFTNPVLLSGLFWNRSRANEQTELITSPVL